MPVTRIDANKKNHQVELMQLVFTADGVFAAECRNCGGYVLLNDEQAANGRAQCFGEVILLSWTKEANGKS
jgi:hypothetical protein